MGAIRIRTGGVEIDVADEAELESLRARGLLGPDTDLWRDGRWAPLQLPAASPVAKAATPRAGDDPWAAWSGADDDAAEKALGAYSRKEPEPLDLPVSAMAPMARPIVVTQRPAELPAEALAPVDAGAVEPVLVEPSELLESTLDPLTEPPATPRPPPAQAAPARPAPPSPAPVGLPPMPDSFGQVAQRRPRTSDAPPATVVDDRDAIRLSPMRIVGFVVVGLLLVGGGWTLYQLSRPMTAPVNSVSSAQPVPAREETGAAAVLAAVEAELRSVSLGEVREVRKPGDLGDAVLIELQELRLDVERVDAPVGKWGGKKRDDPVMAEVRVSFRSGGKLDRELGAIAMVVGRYKQAYIIDIPVVEARWSSGGETRSKMIDATLAERFVQGRASLAQLLGLE